MNLFIKKFIIRNSYKNITLRKNLLNEYNSFFAYSKRLSKIVKEIVF
jgi:hypothetical protein